MTTHGQSPDRYPPGEAEIRAQCQGLEDVCASSNASINGDGDLPLSDGSTLAQGIEGGGDTVELSSTVVRDDHPIEAVGDSGRNILGSVDWLWLQ